MNEFLFSVLTVFSISYLAATIASYSHISALKDQSRRKDKVRKIHLSAVLGDKKAADKWEKDPINREHFFQD